MLVIVAMNILKLAQLGHCLVAIYCDGHLRLWKIADLADFQRGGVKVVGCFRDIFLTEDIQGMQYLESRVVAYSRSALYGVEWNCETLQHSQQPVQPIFKNEKQTITCVGVCSANEVVVGSNKGNVYRYEWQYKRNTRLNRHNHNERLTRQNFDLFCSPELQTTIVTALACQASLANPSHTQPSESRAFIGYSDGTISRYNITSGKQQANYNTHICTSNQSYPVVALKLNPAVNQLYSLHDPFVLVWDITNQTLLYTIDAYRPIDVLVLGQDRAVLVNESNQITYFRVNCSQLLITVQLSSRAAQCATALSYKGKEYVAVGGDNGLLDVLSQHTQIAICVAES